MADREGKPTNNDIREVTKDFQREEKGGADSNSQFREAGHQARVDADKAGELPERTANKAEQGKSSD